MLAEAIVLIPKSANKGTEIQMDVLPLVLCKDCEHCYFASNRVPDERSYACEKHGIDIVPDWFCADGERRNE